MGSKLDLMHGDGRWNSLPRPLAQCPIHPATLCRRASMMYAVYRMIYLLDTNACIRYLNGRGIALLARGCNAQ